MARSEPVAVWSNGAVVLVVCRDGSVWHRPAITAGKWSELDPIPESERASRESGQQHLEAFKHLPEGEQGHLPGR